ncbi:hypothetical protein KB221_07495 [Aquidulcibacter paucihalophilus]|nr:hypothetical protein KB221_07495 [Aquidulcibacter paucihalophilus]
MTELIFFNFDVDWPAWVQAVGSVLAILVAIAVAAHQSRVQQRRDDARDDSYVRGAVIALEHAEAAMSQTQLDLGGMKLVSRDQVLISPSLHLLDAVDNVLSSFPIDRAPSVEVARALTTSRFTIRKVSGGIRAFLSSDNTGCRTNYDEDEAEIARAAIALRAEAKKREDCVRDPLPSDKV